MLPQNRDVPSLCSPPDLLNVCAFHQPHLGGCSESIHSNPQSYQPCLQGDGSWGSKNPHQRCFTQSLQNSPPAPLLSKPGWGKLWDLGASRETRGLGIIPIPPTPGDFSDPPESRTSRAKGMGGGVRNNFSREGRTGFLCSRYSE